MKTLLLLSILFLSILTYGQVQISGKTIDASDTQPCSLLITTGSLEEGEDGGTSFNSFLNLLSTDKFKNISTTKIILPKADHMETAVPTFEKGIELLIKK